jgi:hypothetical protein
MMPGPIYKPVRPHSREIRILVLCPSRRSNGRLKCQLIHIDLDALADAPFEHFEAVSYTWGDVSDRVRIELNRREFSITKNLHALLKRLRAKRTRGYYWVDAICINQENTLERAQQVQLMKAIYETAVQVLVWLGPSGDDGDIAMDLIDEITDADEVDHALDTDEARIERMVVLLQKSLSDSKNNGKWQALAKLFHRPWWKRVWIRQEIGVASEIIVLCGDDRRIPWSTVISAIEYINHVANLFEPFVRSLGGQTSGYSDAIVLDSLREEIKDEGFIDEETLFFYGRGCEATDFRDRIFGLVGLADQQTQDTIVPDYELPGRDVFIMATKYLLTRRDSLDSLSASQGCLGQHDLPSWVIDFSADWPQTLLRFKEHQEDLYRAAATVRPSISFSEQSSSELLHAKGLLIGSITDNSLGYEEEDDDIYCKHVLTTSRVELFKMWWKNRQFATPGRDIEEIMQPWFRTIIVDQDNLGNRASDTYIKDMFPIKEWQDPLSDMNFNVIDEKCEDFCISIPLVSNHAFNRHLFLIDSGLLGLGPRGLTKGDFVCLLYGCGVPMVLRPASNGAYSIVGEAYVHSLMDGEAVESCHQFTERVFTIV